MIIKPRKKKSDPNYEFSRNCSLANNRSEITHIYIKKENPLRLTPGNLYKYKMNGVMNLVGGTEYEVISVLQLKNLAESKSIVCLKHQATYEKEVIKNLND